VVLGGLLRVRSKLRTLVGVGTAICGASAIAAITPVIEAEAADVAYAFSTVFVFNAIAVVLFPLAGFAPYVYPQLVPWLLPLSLFEASEARSRPGRALIKGIGSFPGRKAVLGPHVARSNPYSAFG